MAREVRPPEWVLEELTETGRKWMAARARERAYGPGSDWGKGDNPPAHEQPALEDRATREARALRTRFDELVDEFIDGVEAV